MSRLLFHLNYKRNRTFYVVNFTSYTLSVCKEYGSQLCCHFMVLFASKVVTFSFVRHLKVHTHLVNNTYKLVLYEKTHRLTCQ